jgi:tetratricopeptide (TPR) repeat protein
MLLAVKQEIVMTIRAFFALLMLVLLSGCATFLAGSDMQSGRQAFLIGNNEAAVSYFRNAAQKDPNYVHGTALQQGIWSYVGRSEYATGRLPAAREALERALSANRQEDIARLYLGLTLARDGDRQKGLQEIQGGMKGIYDWLESITSTYRYSFGQYWDIRREIRSSIQGDLAMLDAKDINWPKLLADGEWLGKRIEQESDDARRQESEDRSRDSDGKDGHP